MSSRTRWGEDSGDERVRELKLDDCTRYRPLDFHFFALDFDALPLIGVFDGLDAPVA